MLWGNECLSAKIISRRGAESEYGNSNRFALGPNTDLLKRALKGLSAAFQWIGFFIACSKYSRVLIDTDGCC